MCGCKVWEKKASAEALEAVRAALEVDARE